MLTSGRIVFTEWTRSCTASRRPRPSPSWSKRHGAERVFLMVSGTLNRETDEIEKLRRALGNNCVGTFDRMPRAHAALGRDRRRRARRARRGADLIVTLGGGSITDGAKAVQLCLANDIRSVEAHGRDPRRHADVKPPTVRQISIPTTLSAGEFSGIAGVTDEATKVKELFRHPAHRPAGRDARSRGDAPHADVAVPVDRHPRRRPLRRGRLLRTNRRPYANASALHGLSLLARGLPRVKADPGDMKARLDCQIGSWLSMGGAGGRRADGGEPRHRLRAGRGVRHPARPHLVHHAALGDALEQIRPTPTARR